MLKEFLVDNRHRILTMASEKAALVSADKPPAGADRSVPQLYNHLIVELGRASRGLEIRPRARHGSGGTSSRGKALSRLGYDISQVVLHYGALCEAITELARELNAPITAGEFHTLNVSLDFAIVDAVTGFTESEDLKGGEFGKRMGLRLHELRNALAAAIIAHTMINSGAVGTRGGTNAMLERSLNRIRDILDRSFSDIRVQHESPPPRRRRRDLARR